jgi:hypothetical protein
MSIASSLLFPLPLLFSVFVRMLMWQAPTSVLCHDPMATWKGLLSINKESYWSPSHFAKYQARKILGATKNQVSIVWVVETSDTNILPVPKNTAHSLKLSSWNTRSVDICIHWARIDWSVILNLLRHCGQFMRWRLSYKKIVISIHAEKILGSLKRHCQVFICSGIPPSLRCRWKASEIVNKIKWREGHTYDPVIILRALSVSFRSSLFVLLI